MQQAGSCRKKPCGTGEGITHPERKRRMEMGRRMKAARVNRVGPPDVISIEDIAVPSPGEQDVLVRVRASGVGPWDALVRTGKSRLPLTLPVTLGSEIPSAIGYCSNQGRPDAHEFHAVQCFRMRAHPTPIYRTGFPCSFPGAKSRRRQDRAAAVLSLVGGFESSRAHQKSERVAVRVVARSTAGQWP
jgi:hypothetical protein